MPDIKNVDGMLEVTRTIEQKQIFTREQLEEILSNNLAQLELIKIQMTKAEDGIASVKDLIAQADSLGVTIIQKSETVSGDVNLGTPQENTVGVV